MDPAELEERLDDLARDRRDLTRYVALVRDGIAAMRPSELTSVKLPAAIEEIRAVTKETEAAADKIMSAIEDIRKINPAGGGAQAKLREACTRVVEACAFQDITGQRATKVLRLLSELQAQLENLCAVWGRGIEDAPASEKGSVENIENLHGPALEGEGADQDVVDRILKAR